MRNKPTHPFITFNNNVSRWSKLSVYSLMLVLLMVLPFTGCWLVVSGSVDLWTLDWCFTFHSRWGEQFTVRNFKVPVCCYSQEIMKWATSWENLFVPYANNKAADKPAHMHSCYNQYFKLKLASVAVLASLSLVLSETSKGLLMTWLKDNERKEKEKSPTNMYICCQICKKSCMHEIFSP